MYNNNILYVLICFMILHCIGVKLDADNYEYVT